LKVKIRSIQIILLQKIVRQKLISFFRMRKSEIALESKSQMMDNKSLKACINKFLQLILRQLEISFSPSKHTLCQIILLINSPLLSCWHMALLIKMKTWWSHSMKIKRMMSSMIHKLIRKDFSWISKVWLTKANNV